MCKPAQIGLAALAVGAGVATGGFGFPAALSAAGLTTAVGGSIASSRAEQEALRLQQRAETIKAARERRQLIREANIKRAAIIQAGANQGASTSSAVTGGAGSITSQLSSGLSFLDQIAGINTATNKAIQKSSTAQSISGLGGTIFSAGMALDKIASAKTPQLSAFERTIFETPRPSGTINWFA